MHLNIDMDPVKYLPAASFKGSVQDITEFSEDEESSAVTPFPTLKFKRNVMAANPRQKLSVNSRDCLVKLARKAHQGGTYSEWSADNSDLDQK